jgi:hypothetical protein
MAKTCIAVEFADDILFHANGAQNFQYQVLGTIIA